MMTARFWKFSQRLVAGSALALALLLVGCKNDAGSCSEGCQDSYFECNRQAVLFTSTPNGDKPDNGNDDILLLALGCESDRAVCVAHCSQAISAQ